MTKALEKAHQVKAIMELYEHDSELLNPKAVQHFTKPFGIKGFTYKAKGKTNDLDSQDAHKVALKIAGHLGIKVPHMDSVGSQLRVACTMILKSLRQKAPSPENA